MNFKKTIAGISALSLLLSNSAVTASAADNDKDYTDAKITAYVYSPENVQEMNCRYYADKPNIPYISFSDYYKIWAGEDAVVTNNNDGTYEVKVPIGVTGTIDVNKDIISSDDREYFLGLKDSFTGTSEYDDLMLKTVKKNDHKPVAFDFELSKYNIDILGDGDEVWFPASTLCDTFESDLKMASYSAGSMFFFNDLLSDFSRVSLQDAEYIQSVYQQYSNGRPKDLAEYSYNELCFVIDNYYGYPGRMPLGDVLAEKGFDGMLSETNDATRKIKEYLLSENMDEYYAGFHMLNNLFWDGGHSAFVQAYSFLGKEKSEYVESLKIPTEEIEGGVDFIAVYLDWLNSGNGAAKALGKMLENADEVVKLSMSLYSKKGDTAVFTFNEFYGDIEEWNKYYHENGELPEDTISDFSKAIDMASKDPEVKKFVIDLGANSGGLSAVVEYMMGVIKDIRKTTIKNSVLNTLDIEEYDIDKNLDKSIDEKDDSFADGLEFGVIASNYSFSCGNWLPSLAHDNGILLMGEKSGGGACAVHASNTPDGNTFTISSGSIIIDKDGNSVDLGIEPDYNMVKLNDDGTKDYSELYNYNNLSKKFDEFYGKTAPAPTETDTTTTTVTTTSATTTTTTSTESSTTEASTTTKAPESTTTAEVTTTAEAKTIGTSDEIGKMAEKDYFAKTGKVAAASEAKENKDGTYTYELKDEKGNVVDTYTIDPVTGKGKDADGKEVDLPQTGINSLGTAGAAAASVMLILAGAAAVCGSGILRKKEDE